MLYSTLGLAISPIRTCTFQRQRVLSENLFSLCLTVWVLGCTKWSFSVGGTLTVEDSFLVDCNLRIVTVIFSKVTWVISFSPLHNSSVCLLVYIPCWFPSILLVISLWMYKALALFSSVYSKVSLTSLKPCKSLKFSLERTESLCRVVSKDKGCFSVVQMNTVSVISLFFTQVCRFIIGVLLRGSSLGNFVLWKLVAS